MKNMKEDEFDFSKITYKDLKDNIKQTDENMLEIVKEEGKEMLEEYGYDESILICDDAIKDCNDANIDDRYWHMLKKYLNENK